MCYIKRYYIYISIFHICLAISCFRLRVKWARERLYQMCASSRNRNTPQNTSPRAPITPNICIYTKHLTILINILITFNKVFQYRAEPNLKEPHN